MIIYVILKKPIQNKIDYINIWVLEGVIFLANMAALALVSMHYAGNHNMSTKNSLADVIIICSYIIDYMAIIFFVTKVVAISRTALVYRKEQSKAEKGVWLQLLFLPFQQGGMGFEQVRILEGSQDNTRKVLPDVKVKGKMDHEDLDLSSSRAPVKPSQVSPSRSFVDNNPTGTGSPSIIRSRKLKSKFNFTKSSLMEISPSQTEQVSDNSPQISPKGSPIMSANLDLTNPELGNSITNRKLLGSAARVNRVYPLIKPVPAEEIDLSKIDLPDSKPGNSFVLHDLSPEESSQERSKTPSVDVQRESTPESDNVDKDKFIHKSFLDKARLRRGMKPKQRIQEDESVFTLTSNNVSNNSVSKKSMKSLKNIGKDELPEIQPFVIGEDRKAKKNSDAKGDDWF